MSLAFEDVVPPSFLVIPQMLSQLETRVEGIEKRLGSYSLFSHEDKALITSLVESNRAQSAQISALLAEIEHQRAYASSLAGPSSFVAADAATQGEKAGDSEEIPPPPTSTPPKSPTPPPPPTSTPPKSPTPPPSPTPSTAVLPPTDLSQGETERRESKKRLFGKEVVEEEDPLIADIDAQLAEGSSTRVATKPLKFIVPATGEIVCIDDPAELRAQEEELRRLNAEREQQLASAAEVSKFKEEEAKAYKKLAAASERKLDATALQVKEMERIAAEKEKKHAEKEKKRAEQWAEYQRVMNFRRLPEPISELQWAVKDGALNMTVYRGNSPFNFDVIRDAKVGMFGYQEWVEMLEVLKKKRKSKITTDIMEALGKRFQWVKNLEKKFNVDSSKPATEQTPAAEPSKKRKRTSGDGVERKVLIEPTGEGITARNLTVPVGVKFKEGMVIREPEFGMFFTNTAMHECFQRVDELHLCSTWQLYLLRSTCIQGGADSEFLSLVDIELEPRDKDSKLLKKAKLEELNAS